MEPILLNHTYVMSIWEESPEFSLEKTRAFEAATKTLQDICQVIRPERSIRISSPDTFREFCQMMSKHIDPASVGKMHSLLDEVIQGKDKIKNISRTQCTESDVTTICKFLVDLVILSHTLFNCITIDDGWPKERSLSRVFGNIISSHPMFQSPTIINKCSEIAYQINGEDEEEDVPGQIYAHSFAPYWEVHKQLQERALEGSQVLSQILQESKIIEESKDIEPGKKVTKKSIKKHLFLAKIKKSLRTEDTRQSPWILSDSFVLSHNSSTFLFYLLHQEGERSLPILNGVSLVREDQRTPSLIGKLCESLSPLQENKIFPCFVYSVGNQRCVVPIPIKQINTQEIILPPGDGLLLSLMITGKGLHPWWDFYRPKDAACPTKFSIEGNSLSGNPSITTELPKEESIFTGLCKWTLLHSINTKCLRFISECLGEQDTSIDSLNKYVNELDAFCKEIQDYCKQFDFFAKVYATDSLYTFLRAYSKQKKAIKRLIKMDNSREAIQTIATMMRESSQPLSTMMPPKQCSWLIQRVVQYSIVEGHGKILPINLPGSHCTRFSIPASNSHLLRWSMMAAYPYVKECEKKIYNLIDMKRWNMKETWCDLYIPFEALMEQWEQYKQKMNMFLKEGTITQKSEEIDREPEGFTLLSDIEEEDSPPAAPSEEDLPPAAPFEEELSPAAPFEEDSPPATPFAVSYTHLTLPTNREV